MADDRQEMKRMELAHKGWEEFSNYKNGTIIIMRRDYSPTPDYKQWEYCTITENGEIRTGFRLIK